MQEILEKIKELKTLDPEYKLFGSKSHNYELNNKISTEKVNEFETKYNFVVPDQYKRFVTEVGNGGVGPYYGVESIENCILADLSRRDPNYLMSPDQPFPLTEPLGTREKEYSFEELEEFQDDKYVHGSINICNFGCGAHILLIVNGPELGNIWFDDRCSDGGIYPIQSENMNRIDFVTWYKEWIDRYIEKAKKLI